MNFLEQKFLYEYSKYHKRIGINLYQGDVMETKFIDWHQADIIAGLRKKGTSLAAESRKNGLSSSTLANALSRSWPKGELIIARALGTEPWVIWPSRYYDPVTHAFIDKTKFMRKKRADE